MQTKSLILGNHAFFVRDGTVLTKAGSGNASVADPGPYGNSGPENKPDHTEVFWLDLGVIGPVEPDPKGEYKTVFGASPGKIVPVDRIKAKQEPVTKIECRQLQNLVFELIYGAAPISGGGDISYNEMSGSIVKGWVKIQQYDQNDNLVNTVDKYGSFELSGAVKFDEDVVKADLEMHTLFSSQNVGVLKA